MPVSPAPLDLFSTPRRGAPPHSPRLQRRPASEFAGLPGAGIRPAAAWPNRRSVPWAALGTLFLLIGGLPLHAAAQDHDAPVKRYTPPSRIAWELTVMTDGKQTDKLTGNTAVGQSATVTRHWNVSHPVGCEGAQTAPVQFSRTVTLSPLGVDRQQVIGFSVDTQETIDDDTPQTVRSDGCALPAAPRTITAHHPEWDVASGQSVSWTIVPHHPTLVYQLTAHVAGATPASTDTASGSGNSGAGMSRDNGMATPAASQASGPAAP